MSATLTAPQDPNSLSTELLPDLPLFEGFSSRHRQILAECSMHASFRTGEKVVETGEPADCFYLVISGSITLEAPGGRAPSPIKTIGPGDILGWSWLFPLDCWHFDAVAGEPAELIYFYASRLRQECDRDQELGYELFKRLAQRNNTAKATLASMDPVHTAAFPSGPGSDDEPSLSFARASLNSFALAADSAAELQRNTSQTAASWPGNLFAAAKAAIRSVGGIRRERSATPVPHRKRGTRFQFSTKVISPAQH